MTWKPIETAPKDKRLLIWSGQEMYCAQKLRRIDRMIEEVESGPK